MFLIVINGNHSNTADFSCQLGQQPCGIMVLNFVNPIGTIFPVVTVMTKQLNDSTTTKQRLFQCERNHPDQIMLAENLQLTKKLSKHLSRHVHKPISRKQYRQHTNESLQIADHRHIQSLLNLGMNL